MVSLCISLKFARSSTAANSPKDIVDRHVDLLHEFNEIRDVALQFIGKIAEKDGVPVADVLKRYDMDETDAKIS